MPEPIRSMEDLLFRIETLERSDLWVYVTCDRDDDGSLRLVNATGFFPDEMTAALAGQTYIRKWSGDDIPPEIFPLPFFDERQVP